MLPLFFSAATSSVLSLGVQQNSREQHNFRQNENSYGNDQGIEAMLGFGIVLIVVGVVIVYGLLFLRLWGYVSLLNGTNRVSLFDFKYICNF